MQSWGLWRPDAAISVAERVVRLARRLGILAGTFVILGGCMLGGPGAPGQLFDLSAPREFEALGGQSRAQILVQQPAAVRALDTDRILVSDRIGLAYLSGAQWADDLPRLLQSRMVDAFDNAGRLRAVGRPGQGLLIDYEVVSDIRAFELQTSGGDRAMIEISVNLVDDSNGRVVARRIFTAEQPARGPSAAATVEALDAALQRVLTDLVVWTLDSI